MANYQNATELSKLTLGKSTQYVSKYTVNLLQGVPRSLNRDDLALNQSNLPFVGEDVWYGYELSWLNEKGKPIVAVAEFRFPCTSENIVESKSFKLYLNSFNQTRFARVTDVENILTKDLSNIAGSPVKVSLFGVDYCPALNIAKNIDKSLCIDGEDISIDNYQYDAKILVGAQNKEDDSQKEEHLVSHLLKSNCLITNQPDWASISIHYRGKSIDHAILLRYLISFRQHNEFHEQCVERIYCDLQQFCQLDELTIFARYTRRGGLDINPFRSSHKKQAPFARTLRQ
ncbi:MAG: NADPH-dependent 7-cyano-7-deazaguanine reductase QueF [Colwellia sp.]